MGNSTSVSFHLHIDFDWSFGRKPEPSVEKDRVDTTEAVLEVPLECSTDAFYRFFKEEANKLHRSHDHKEVVETAGSGKWMFFHPTDTTEYIKYIITAVDEVSKKITFKVMEGEFMQFYHDFTVTLEVAAHSMAKWTVKYVKKDNSNSDDSFEVLRDLSIAVNTYLKSKVTA